MHLIKKRGFRLNQINKIAIIGLITAISIAMINTIWSVYLESILKNPSLVGFLTTYFTFVAVIAQVLLIPTIERNGKSSLYAIALALYAVSYLLFAFLTNIWAILIIGTLYGFVITLRMNSYGIILRDKSKDEEVPKNVGLVYTFFNIAFLVGPLIAGFISQKLGFKSVFITSALLMLVSILVFKNFKIKDKRHENKADTNFFEVLKDFLSDKDRKFIYILGGGVPYWWAFIYIYLPIYIIEKGLNEIVLGIFLAAVTIPLITTEYRYGLLTEKKGFKKMFFIGYIIVGLCALACFFIPNVYVKLSLIILASFGMARIEPTTESYFFEIIKKEERDKYYGPYNTTLDFGSIIASLISAFLLMYFKFDSLFIFFGLSMIVFAIISTRLKDIKCQEMARKNHKKNGIKVRKKK